MIFIKIMHFLTGAPFWLVGFIWHHISVTFEVGMDDYVSFINWLTKDIEE